MSRIRTLVVSALVAGLSVSAAGVATGSPTPARADLRITGGKVTQHAGRLTGSFTVADTGRARAVASTATMAVAIGRQPRLLARFKIPALAAGVHRKVTVTFPTPNLPDGDRRIQVCADTGHQVLESLETNNCGYVGSLAISTPDSVPTDPVPFQKSTVFTLNDALSNYWIYVPASYDASNRTPTKLLIWLHGCASFSSDDISHVSPGSAQDWISVAVGGEENRCWDVNTDDDTNLVLAALADVKTHFNIDPRRVVLGGYSSGGWLAYQVGLEHALDFAGLIVMNSTPISFPNAVAQVSLAAWKLNIVHLAHLQDDEFPIAQVRTDTSALTKAGYPFQLITTDGGHGDAPGAIENGHPVPGTWADLRTFLLPKIDAGWEAPAG